MSQPIVLKKCRSCGTDVPIAGGLLTPPDCPRCGAPVPLTTSDPTVLLPTEPALTSPDDAPAPDRSGIQEIPARLGEYRILRLLGEGGMGTVFEAEQTSLHRKVALKVLSSGYCFRGSARERFRREAEAAARLDHAHIVKVFGIGEDRGQLFFAMEKVDGRNLETVLAQERITFEHAARLARDLADALHYAHEHGVIHRDVKPANVILTAEDRVLLTDFGLARVDGGTGLTRDGMAFGTPAYMSPEQALGRQDDVGPITDVYSLGATLYELVTTRKPFDAPTAEEIIRLVVDRDPVPPRRINPRIPADLETIIEKAMEKMRERRYPSAAELRDDLDRFIRGEPIRARPVSVVGIAVRKVRKHRGIAAVTLGFLVILAGLVVSFLESRLAAKSLEDQRIAALLDQAEVQLAQAGEARKQAADLRARADGQATTPEEKLRVRREFRHVLARAEAALEAGATAAQQALGIRPHHREARRRLCKLLLAQAHHFVDTEKFERAEAAVFLLPTLDDRREFTAELRDLERAVRGTCDVSLSTNPPGARAAMRTFVEVEMDWTEEHDLGVTPLKNLPLAMGSILLVLRFPGHTETLHPLLLERNATLDLSLDLLPEELVPPEMVYVPAGSIRSGDPDAGYVTRTIPGFLIDRHETTAGEYLEYFDSLSDAVEKGRRVPSMNVPDSFLWAQGKVDPSRHPFPICGVSLADAKAYAKFRGKRLPTPWEWEKAARGADGRVYPWGNRYEPGRSAAHGHPGKGPQGLFPADSLEDGASPYGILHMVGNVSEYLGTPARGRAVLMGGSVNEGPLFHKVFTTLSVNPAEKVAGAGIRLAMDLPDRK